MKDVGRWLFFKVTLAGYIFWQLGHLPDIGKQLTIGGLTFEVVSTEGRNIDKVRILPVVT